MTQDETVGWHHSFSGHEFEKTHGDSEGQGSLVCCRQWDHKEPDTTERLHEFTLTFTVLRSQPCSHMRLGFLLSHG